MVEYSPQLKLLRSEWVSALLTSSLLSWLSLLCLLLPTLLALLLLACVLDALLCSGAPGTLLAAYISSLVSHFLPQQPPNPPHNCKLLKHCLHFPAFSYSCPALCSEDWTFLRPRFFLQISSSQWWWWWYITRCKSATLLWLSWIVYSSQELPRRATGQKETVEMRGHEFCYSKCRSLSQMNAGNERPPPPEQALCALLLPSPVLTPCAS